MRLYFFFKKLSAIFFILTVPLIFSLNAEAQTTKQIYWGALIDAPTVGVTCGNPPWCMDGKDQNGNTASDAVSLFENHAQKKISILHWGTPWFNSTSWPTNNYYPFQTNLFEKVRARGSISLFTWGPWDGNGNKTTQPNFSLSRIINGSRYGANCDITVTSTCKTFDMFITEWATAAKNWGYPFFLRFAWEMNGSWYSWSEKANGNQPGDYVNAWRHVHDIFTQVGATNVTWVWCPNVDFSGSIALEGLYPGNTYVDWTCMDGYNFGTDPAKPDSWKTFSQVFTPTYNHIQTIAPNKPMMIAETSSSEIGGSKASWITDGIGTQLPNNFPNIHALVWFNWNFPESGGVIKYSIESSSTSQTAFANAINKSNYVANTFSNLPKLQPIQPISSAPTSTPTSSPTPNPTITISPTNPPSPSPTSALCSLKNQGDSDCNGRIDLADFEIWRKEFTGSAVSKTADFNSDAAINIIDFEIWRKSYLK
jgi:hypothetical protein